MTNDELILEIIEKVHEQVEKTAGKVDVLQIEQIRQGEMHRINAENLKLHMARTEASEARLAILEKERAFVFTACRLISYVAAGVLFLIKVIPFCESLLARL